MRFSKMLVLLLAIFPIANAQHKSELKAYEVCYRVKSKGSAVKIVETDRGISKVHGADAKEGIKPGFPSLESHLRLRGICFRSFQADEAPGDEPTTTSNWSRRRLGGRG